MTFSVPIEKEEKESQILLRLQVLLPLQITIY